MMKQQRFNTWLLQWTHNATREDDIANAPSYACPLAFVVSIPRLYRHCIMALEMLSQSVLSRYTKSKDTSFASGCSGLSLSKKWRHPVSSSWLACTSVTSPTMIAKNALSCSGTLSCWCEFDRQLLSVLSLTCTKHFWDDCLNDFAIRSYLKPCV